jgi:sirohydrochlorin ferrochelatase
MTKGIMIAGYGTRKGNLEQVLSAQAARMRARGIENVYIGYFRVSKPSIPEALAQMVGDGIDEVLVLPYYIAEGDLTRRLIPEKLGINGSFGVSTTCGKEVKVQMAPAFGLGSTLADIACDRIADSGAGFDDGILVIGHGTKDPLSGNSGTVANVAERLKRIGYKHVAYCFNEFNEPSIKDALAQLESAGVNKIAAVPVFIAMGVHLGEEVPEQIGIPAYSKGGDIETAGKKVHVDYLRPMEDDPRLLEIMVKRARDFYGI